MYCHKPYLSGSSYDVLQSSSLHSPRNVPCSHKIIFVPVGDGVSQQPITRLTQVISLILFTCVHPVKPFQIEINCLGGNISRTKIKSTFEVVVRKDTAVTVAV